MTIPTAAEIEAIRQRRADAHSGGLFQRAVFARSKESDDCDTLLAALDAVTVERDSLRHDLQLESERADNNNEMIIKVRDAIKRE